MKLYPYALVPDPARARRTRELKVLSAHRTRDAAECAATAWRYRHGEKVLVLHRGGFGFFKGQIVDAGQIRLYRLDMGEEK